MGEKVQRYQKKGSVVQVIGKMKSSKKDKTTYWELRANNIVFLPLIIIVINNKITLKCSLVT